MIPDLGIPLPLAALVAAAILAVVLARRVPVLRVALNLVSWVILGGLLIVVLQQRQQFDPYIQRAMQALNLQDQNVVGDTVRIRMSPDGHFWARVTIDDVSRRMLVDSGATLTALSTDTARAVGLKPAKPVFPVILNTANGMIRAQTAQIDSLRIGTIRADDVPVVVSPAFGDTDVLGMNFLSRLKSWRVEGSTLILEPHHPQPLTGRS
ncbi:retropepsin-like aspartic protease family protein [Sphingomonas sanguinis]|jgi:aspartyl protease family protein|uniref:TIGR02281 family clan AA aspartic protease n=1 Tax=Sphingomonas sanguinis TaxID=33051 RepID=A0A7Y7QUD9_9SPHN|nr:TIGR02281 family clan AA aspartic protease [Sphingomonas sanguinis]MBZ6381549.1 TIGR02281 family clan AA aspartic protease [Sphingomonas sanguinis]NNG51190.1 TIGR02281 family clan AA aspartic protease [Sphingomonas sanguinis]NNG52864.1 TIGR02281 family clan AA aspartic protease [Sphingomonas sanguinis]NVP30851.1 TIGR02281 family clan AA aspartic protease [Sphingomonas sanguinis]